MYNDSVDILFGMFIMNFADYMITNPEKRIFINESSNNWFIPDSLTNCSTIQNYRHKVCGVMNWKRDQNDAYLFPLRDEDSSFIKNCFPKIKVKEHERIYRYVTANMIGSSNTLMFMPLIKVNLKNNMIYFLDESEEKFETRGTKMKYIHLLSSEKDL